MTLNAPQSFSTGSTSDEFQKLLELNCLSGVVHFRKILKSHLLFHLVFAAIFFTETIVLISLLNQAKPGYLAIGLSSFVLCVFSYLVLLFYFQAKKREQFKQLVEWLITFTRQSLEKDFAEDELHFIIAHVLYEFSHYFQLKELPKYFSHINIEGLQRILKKLSFLLHWKDFLRIRELILLQSLNEHLVLLKHDPTHLEVHGSLAWTYLSLAKIYKSMIPTLSSYERENFSLKDLDETLQEKIRKCVQRALEEYKILDDLVPHDPWVLAQLASCHHEIEEYNIEIDYLERILSLSDSNDEIQLQLASLYFQEGHYAKGFKIYRILKQHEIPGADILMDDYISGLVETHAL